VVPMTDTERRDLMELLEERCDESFTILTTQLATKSRHEAVGEPTAGKFVRPGLCSTAMLVRWHTFLRVIVLKRP
jgi:hypothetical protein